MNEIEAVIEVFEKQIQALYTNDFEKFLSFMTPRIQKELSLEIFQKAIDLYKRTPIDINAIDHNKSKLYNEGESEEILDKHVKLVLVGSGRTLCHVVYLNGTWLIDDRYWRITDLDEEETSETDEEPTNFTEVESGDGDESMDDNEDESADEDESEFADEEEEDVEDDDD
ncbi:MAG: hypothetical protein EU530_04255 [Promethearchaeota archaeon]|nr:MAG: hypothetical protein EU530_04255 [Candidatus Lokiarchaeota archaeon]